MTSITIIFLGLFSFMAEYSNPGDVFYPIKIYVNENVSSAITIGDVNEAELQLEFIRNRINERNQLSQQGKLTRELDQQIKNQIKEYGKRFNKEMEGVKSSKKNDSYTKLRTTFNNMIAAVGISENEVSPRENTYNNVNI